MPRHVPVELNIVLSIALVLSAAVVVGWCAAPGDLKGAEQRSAPAHMTQQP